MPILIALVIALSGGVSFAAQNSLPGDVLYPVKTHVNEQVQGAFALSDEAKANWNAEIADNRLKEAEELAAKSELSADAKAQIEANFKEHADKTEALIQKLDAKVGAEVGANLETSLKTHERILSDIGLSKDGDQETRVRALLDTVKAESDDSSEVTAKAESLTRSEGAPNVQTAAEGRRNAAQNKIDEVQRFIDRNKDGLGADATARVQAQMKVATDLMAKADTELTAKFYGQAFVDFGNAFQAAQEVKLLVQAKAHFENGIKTSTSPLPAMSQSPKPSPSPDSSQGEEESEPSSENVHIQLKF